MTAFISGPMSGYEDFNYPAFHEAGKLLSKVGIEFESPAHMCTGQYLYPPRADDALPWDYYMRKSLRQLLQCKAIIMLPGWQDSRGAQLEKQVAEALGMVVLYLGYYES